MNDLNLEEKMVETGNGKIHYFTGQKFAERPTLVLLHGLSSNHTTWNFFSQAAKRHNLNFLAPDLRGHGHSDKTKLRNLYKIPVFSDDLKRILTKENLPKIILIGYSFGGYIALDFAVKNPESVAGLVLISTNFINPLKYKKLAWLTLPAYIFLNFLALLLLWQKRKKYYYFEQGSSKGYWHSTLKGFTTMPISINLWMLSETSKIDFSRDLEKIFCPTLIIKSKSDPFLSLEEAKNMTRSVKRGVLINLEEPTHFLASLHQEKISEIIVNFLKQEKIYENSDF